MLLLGDTAVEETLFNIGCALQVLSDATVHQGHFDELTRGWWLLLQKTEFFNKIGQLRSFTQS